MSGWDAPSGGWDPDEESAGPGSDEQDFRQTQPTGGHRAARGADQAVRAGRRGLPGYDQAQGFEQTVRYGQPQSADPRYDQQQNSDPRYDQTWRFDQPAGSAQTVGYDQGQPAPYDQGS